MDNEILTGNATKGIVNVDEKSRLLNYLEGMVEYIKREHVRVLDFNCSTSMDSEETGQENGYIVRAYTGRESISASIELFNEKRRDE